jgi:hypothetical protein
MRHPAHPHPKSTQHQWRLLHKSRNSLTTVTTNPEKYKGVQNWPVSVKKNPQKKWSCQSILKTSITRAPATLYQFKQFMVITQTSKNTICAVRTPLMQMVKGLFCKKWERACYAIFYMKDE